MAWKVNFTKSAEKEFSKLPYEIRILIINYLREKVTKTPREYGKALVTLDKIRLWRYRIQNYRLICNINDAELSILVIRVGKRESVYKTL